MCQFAYNFKSHFQLCDFPINPKILLVRQFHFSATNQRVKLLMWLSSHVVTGSVSKGTHLLIGMGTPADQMLAPGYLPSSQDISPKTF